MKRIDCLMEVSLKEEQKESHTTVSSLWRWNWGMDAWKEEEKTRSSSKLDRTAVENMKWKKWKSNGRYFRRLFLVVWRKCVGRGKKAVDGGIMKWNSCWGSKTTILLTQIGRQAKKAVYGIEQGVEDEDSWNNENRWLEVRSKISKNFQGKFKKISWNEGN